VLASGLKKNPDSAAFAADPARIRRKDKADFLI